MMKTFVITWLGKVATMPWDGVLRLVSNSGGSIQGRPTRHFIHLFLCFGASFPIFALLVGWGGAAVFAGKTILTKQMCSRGTSKDNCAPSCEWVGGWHQWVGGWVASRWVGGWEAGSVMPQKKEDTPATMPKAIGTRKCGLQNTGLHVLAWHAVLPHD